MPRTARHTRRQVFPVPAPPPASSIAAPALPFWKKSDRPLIRFNNVSLRYGQGPEVLSRLSFRFEPGSFHFVEGESGAGKSSLIRALSLTLPIAAGEMTLLGRDVTKLTRHDRALLRRRLGVVFQDFRLLDHLSVLDNVLLPLTLCGQAEASAKQDAEDLLSWIGLGGVLDAKPPVLSGGEQQRVAIARAVIGKPSLLLADEPTGNLDQRLAQRLLHLFEELNKMGTTVVIATHDKQLLSRFPYPVLRLGRNDGAAVASASFAGSR